MRITVTNTSSDALQRMVWTFWVTSGYHVRADQLAIVLNSYALQQRGTRRHSWRSTQNWQRLSRRGSTLVAPPEVPQDVREDALRQLMASVAFVIEGEEVAK